MTTIAITGAEGQLGRVLTAYYRDRARVVAWSRRELDITDAAQVRRLVAGTRPSVIFNCAAWNDVDGAELHPTRALEVNAMAVRTLGQAAGDVGATLVHYGTDFVFDGTASQPYRESDAPAPRSVYAASKLIGEWMAADAERHYVLRVESLYGAAHAPGANRVGSIDRIIESLDARRPATVFVDRVVSPSYLPDVAAATDALLTKNAPWGLYHVVNDGHCTWYELAQHIAAELGATDCLQPVESGSLALKAARPAFAALSSRRLAETAFVMPTWQDALSRYLAFRRR